MAEPVLRPATPADFPALSAIWLEASLRAHGFLGAARLRGQRRHIEEVHLPQAETWIAGDPDPLGFVSLVGHFVAGLFVAPAAQRRGIGGMLVAKARALRGDLVLEAYAANAGALRFYRAQGFRETARRPVDGAGLPFETVRLILP